MPTPEQRIRDFYEFDFPEDFFRFREFVAELPRKLLDDACEMHPTFAFDVAAGRKPKDYPDHPYWEDRFYNDLPEFVTVLRGGTGGLHWGYVFDAPGEHPPVVARFWNSDTIEHEIDGDTLFEAVRYRLEWSVSEYQEMMEDEPDEAAYYRKRLKQLDKLRDKLSKYFGADRPETGEDYTDIFGDSAWREPVAETWDHLGIVVPKGKYRKLKSDPFADPHTGEERKITKTVLKPLVAQAREQLAAGYPGAALKLGRDLWVWARPHPVCYDLLDEAYAALGREPLRRLLAEARAYRAYCDQGRE